MGDSADRLVGRDSLLVGLTHHRFHDVAPHLTEGISVVLERQPSNPHDSNAVAVFVEHSEIEAAGGGSAISVLSDGSPASSEYPLGYIQAKDAVEIAALMDSAWIDEAGLPGNAKARAILKGAPFDAGKHAVRIEIVDCAGSGRKTPKAAARKSPKRAGTGARVEIWL